MEREIFPRKIRLEGNPYLPAERKCRALAAAFSEAAGRDGEPAVWLVKREREAVGLAAAGACVIQVLETGQEEEFCPGADWCLQLAPGQEAVEQRFLWNVWLRKQGLPWHITQTGRLCLREIMEQDLDFLFQCGTDPLSARFSECPGRDRKEGVEKLAAYRRYMYGFYGFGIWLVLEKESGRPVGRAGLQLREGFEEPELGFEIAAECRGRGYAKEAVGAVLTYAGQELGLSALRAVTERENRGSRYLCERMGFVREAVPEGAGKNLIFYRRLLAGQGPLDRGKQTGIK